MDMLNDSQSTMPYPGILMVSIIAICKYLMFLQPPKLIIVILKESVLFNVYSFTDVDSKSAGWNQGIYLCLGELLKNLLTK